MQLFGNGGECPPQLILLVVYDSDPLAHGVFTRTHGKPLQARERLLEFALHPTSVRYVDGRTSNQDWHACAVKNGELRDQQIPRLTVMNPGLNCVEGCCGANHLLVVLAVLRSHLDRPKVIVHLASPIIAVLWQDGLQVM